MTEQETFTKRDKDVRDAANVKLSIILALIVVGIYAGYILYNYL